MTNKKVFIISTPGVISMTLHLLLHLTNGPNKPECFSLATLSSLVQYNTLTYWASKKMKCCEYDSRTALNSETSLVPGAWTGTIGKTPGGNLTKLCILRR
jgi:hypothetical protein